MKSIKKILIIFFSLIGFLVIVGLVCGLTMNKDDETAALDDLTLTHRAETHAESVKCVKIYAGDVLTATTLSTDKLTAKVTAIALEEDFTFMINEKTYSWNEDVAGEEWTGAFGVDVNQDEKSVTIGATLEEAMNAYALTTAGTGAKIVYGTLPVADMFRLTVAAGKQSLDVDFSALASATQITLDTDRIVFEP